MSRLSFIVFCIGLVIVAACGVFVPPAPVVAGDFIDDFFGSETSEIIPSDEREKAAYLIKINHAVPRYTFFSSNYSLTKVDARFCLPADGSELYSQSGETYDLESCEWVSYAESLLLISFVAFIIAILVFPFLFCGLSLGRCCCCGLYRPSPGICCGDPDDFEATTHGYGLSVCVLFILSIACCAVIAAGAGVGIYGSVIMTKNVHDMANFTNRTAHTFADIIDSVVSIFRSIDEMRNISAVIDPQTLESADNVTRTIRNVSNLVAQYADVIDTPRQIFMYVSLGGPFVLMVLVTLSCLACWWMSWGMSFFGFILTFLSLVTFGFLYPMTSGIADVCVFLDDALAHPETDNFINSVFSCGEGSVLSGLTEMGSAVFETGGNVTCSLYSTLEELFLPCDTDGDGLINVVTDRCPLIKFDGSDECNFETYSNLSRSSKMYDRKIGCFCEVIPDGPQYQRQWDCNDNIHSLWNVPEEDCPSTIDGKKCRPMYCSDNSEDLQVSLEYCSKNCVDEDMRINATLLLNFTIISAQIFDLYNDMIKPYLNCESVVGITTHAKDFICVNMMNSVTPMYIGEALAAFGSFVGTFVALLSTKRFRKKNRRKYANKKETEMELLRR